MNEMLVSTYNIWILILAGCFYMAFPGRGEVTSRDTGIINILSALIGSIIALNLRQNLLSGQILESFEFTSNLNGGGDATIFLIVALSLFVIFTIDMIYYIKQRWN